MYGNYFYYGNAIVKNARNVMVAPNVFINSYVRGNNTDFIARLTIDEQVSSVGGVLEGKQSLLCFAVPVDENVDEVNVIDIRGTDREGLPMPAGEDGRDKATSYTSSE